MDQSVLQQAHLALECLVTLAALVRSLVRVRPQVRAQISGGGEGLPTGGAAVRSGACVDGLVLL